MSKELIESMIYGIMKNAGVQMNESELPAFEKDVEIAMPSKSEGWESLKPSDISNEEAESSESISKEFGKDKFKGSKEGLDLSAKKSEKEEEPEVKEEKKEDSEKEVEECLRNAGIQMNEDVEEDSMEMIEPNETKEEMFPEVIAKGDYICTKDGKELGRVVAEDNGKLKIIQFEGEIDGQVPAKWYNKDVIVKAIKQKGFTIHK